MLVKRIFSFSSYLRRRFDLMDITSVLIAFKNISEIVSMSRYSITVQCSTVQYRATQYSAVQNSVDIKFSHYLLPFF